MVSSWASRVWGRLRVAATVWSVVQGGLGFGGVVVTGGLGAVGYVITLLNTFGGLPLVVQLPLITVGAATGGLMVTGLARLLLWAIQWGRSRWLTSPPTDPETVRVLAGVSNHGYGLPIHGNEVCLETGVLYTDVVFPAIGGQQFYTVEVPSGFVVEQWERHTRFPYRRGTGADLNRWYVADPTTTPDDPVVFRLQIDPAGPYYIPPDLFDRFFGAGRVSKS